jgi:uncharacterized membrane protein
VLLACAIAFQWHGAIVAATIGLTVAAGLPIKWAGMVGLGELLFKPFIYFLHERMWYSWSKFGLKKDK